MDIRERNHKWWNNLDEKRMVATITIDDGEGVEIEVDIPVKYEVCYVCEGRGSHVNPSVDSHGLTAEDFADDPDFADDYRNGMYDETCVACNGARVFPEPDDRRVSTEAMDAYNTRIDSMHERDAERDAERRFGY